MIEVLIGGAILAAATAAFVAFWKVVYDWCVKLISQFLESFTTLVKSGSNVIAYYYYRSKDGWYRREVPSQRVSKEDCPRTVRDALFKYDEAIVQRY